MQPWFQQRPRVALAVAAGLFAGILAIRLVAGTPEDAFSMLYVLPIALMAVVFLVIVPHIASYRDVWRAVRGLSLVWLIALTLAAAMNVVTFGPPYMAAMPGLRFRPAMARRRRRARRKTARAGGWCGGWRHGARPSRA